MPTPLSVTADVHSFRIGDVRVEPRERRLVDAEGERRLGSRSMAVLRFLAERPGRLLAKDEIIAAVWGGRAVSDDSLSVAIYELRKALGDDARSPRFIETVPAQGYRWLPEVTWEKAARPASGEVRSAPGQPLRAAVQPKTPRFAAGLVLGAGIVALAAALVFALGSGGPSRGASFETLAVLPLADFSPGRSDDDRSFADGMTEALIQALARRGLGVTSRRSVLRFAGGSELSMPEISRQLGADVVIEGSVVRSGERVRISVQLVDGSRDQPLWAGSYEGLLGDVLALQDRVSTAVADEVGRRAPGVVPARPPVELEARPRFDVAALDAYLEGRQAFRRGGAADMAQAVEAFGRAVELAPDFAEAQASLAIAAAGHLPFSRDREATVELAQTAARRAFELEPLLPESLIAKAEVWLIGEPDLRRAKAAFREALSLDPTHVEAAWGLAWLAMIEGRFDDAELWIERSLELDRLAIFPYRMLFKIRLYAERWPEAREAIELAARIDASAATAQPWDLCHRLPAPAQVWQCYRPLLAAQGGQAAADLEQLFRAEGLDGLLRRLIETPPLARRPTAAAAVHMRLGQQETALELLERELASASWALYEINADPAFEPLRGEPRFEALLRRLGLEPGAARLE